MIKTLTVNQVECLAHRFAQKHLSFDEPIPDFSTRLPGILESCLLTPFQKFGGKDLYPSLIRKAGMLFYLMIKNHPFQNGNKRVALMTLLLFLHMNNNWLVVETQALYNFTVWVTSSPAELKDQTAAAIEQFIRNHLTGLAD